MIFANIFLAIIFCINLYYNPKEIAHAKSQTSSLLKTVRKYRDNIDEKFLTKSLPLGHQNTTIKPSSWRILVPPHLKQYSQDKQFYGIIADGALELRNTSTDKPLQILRYSKNIKSSGNLEEKFLPITAFSISPDSTKVITGASGGAQIWDVNSGELLVQLSAKGGGRLGLQYFIFSPNSETVVTGVFRRTGRSLFLDQLKLSSTNDGRLIRELDKYKTDIGPIFSSDSKGIVSVGLNGDIRYWDTDTGKLIREKKWDNMRLFRVELSSNLDSFITAHQDGIVRIWNFDTFSIRHVIDMKEFVSLTKRNYFFRDIGPGISNSITHSGDFFITRSKFNTALVWSMHSGTLVAELSMGARQIGRYDGNRRLARGLPSHIAKIMKQSHIEDKRIDHIEQILSGNFVKTINKKHVRIWNLSE